MSAAVTQLLTPPALAYTRLMERLRNEEPRSGYTSADAIGSLSLSDLATVLQHEPTVLADACCDDAVVEHVCKVLRQDELPIPHLGATVGMKLLTALTHQARRYLWLDYDSDNNEGAPRG